MCIISFVTTKLFVTKDRAYYNFFENLSGKVTVKNLFTMPNLYIFLMSLTGIQKYKHVYGCPHYLAHKLFLRVSFGTYKNSNSFAFSIQYVKEGILLLNTKTLYIAAAPGCVGSLTTPVDLQS